MRPEILFPLYATLESLKGVGPELSKLLKKLGIERVVDMVWHLPSGIAHFPLKSHLKDCSPGEPAALVVHIVNHDIPPRGSRKPYTVICEVQGQQLSLTFFKAYPKTIQTRLPIGEKRLVCGNVDRYLGVWQMAHPERIVSADVASFWKDKSPIYPLTAGLFQSHVQKLVKLALQRVPHLPEWISSSFLGSWPSWHKALEVVHLPQQENDLNPFHPARERLAFDELFADQLALRLIRKKRPHGKSIMSSGHLKEKVLQAFGHPLTSGQQQALTEIENDIASPQRMIRLLQGDVGSGKTLVAFLAITRAIEAGYQAAFLVPTEILANQHAETLKALGDKAGINVALLTSKQKNKKQIYEELSQGAIQVVVGTHALLQEAVQFANLGFVVIDEQHRFGVEQRMNLTSKGKDVDILVMTATPIPRTLRLTAYGDLDVSRILDKPQGRKPIQTRILGSNRLDEVCQGLVGLINQGMKVYWVCPLVEESETLDLAAAKERYEHLKAIFGEDKVGLVYGKQKSDEKDAVMASFKNGNCQILVATTVIEVGIDIKAANVMVIEHAERFGLSQLHQLRGRVGRGTEEGRCLLVYSYPISDVGKRRLQVMRETEDGFKIAEEDLRLRGGGDVLGTKQSGLPSFKLADPFTSSHLLDKAYQAAKELLDQDPELTSSQGQAARTLLYLFGQEKGIHTLASG